MRYFLAATIAASATVWATEPDIDDARRSELAYLLKHDCGSCHGMTLQGGLGPGLLASDLAGKPDAYLQVMIAKGSPDNAMPPWNALLTVSEIDYIIELLRTDAVVEQKD